MAKGVLAGLLVPTSVMGLSESETAALNDLTNIWQQKRANNALLGVYYDSKQAFKNLGVSIPGELQWAHGALGWPAKAVQGLARLQVFEGFSVGGNEDPFEINELLQRNHFDLEFTQTVTSAYKHSCAFITTTVGDTAAGDPPVVIQARDAEWTAARWDSRRRQVKYALAITAAQDNGSPTEMILFTAGMTVTMRQEGFTWRVVGRSRNRARRVLVEPLTYDPQLDRPFGHSRITREVRYLTNAAIRTMLRSELHAEFFSSPQRALLAADKSQFQDEVTWNAHIGRVWAIGLNIEGDSPDLRELSQSSMVPHTEMYRQLAQNFAAATSLPQSSVGLFADNPQSAEAMETAWAPLAAEGEYQWRVFRPALQRVAQNLVMLRDDLDEPPKDSWRMSVNWTPCRYVSPSVAADWAVKAISADPELTGTTVMRRRLGLSQGEIEEVASETRRKAAPSVIEQLFSRSAPVETEVEVVGEPQ